MHARMYIRMPSSSSMPSTMAHAVCRARVIGDTTTSLRTRIVRGCHAGAQAQAYTLNYVKGANFHIKLNGAHSHHHLRLCFESTPSWPSNRPDSNASRRPMEVKLASAHGVYGRFYWSITSLVKIYIRNLTSQRMYMVFPVGVIVSVHVTK